MEPSKSPPLEVPDAETLDEFVSNARAAWYEAHPEMKGQPGRDIDEKIIEPLKDHFEKYGSSKMSQNHRVKTIRQELTATYGDEAPSEASIRRYVRLFLLFKKALENGTPLSPKDIRWLNENFPSKDTTIDHVTEILVVVVPLLKKIGQDIDRLRSVLNQHGIDTSSRKFDRLVLRLVNLFPTPAETSA